MDPSLAKMALPPPPGELPSTGTRIIPVLAQNNNSNAAGVQQPTPPNDLGAVPDFFTYFDEAFWNNINFSDFDFGLQDPMAIS